MINTTNGDIVFRKNGVELHQAIVSALQTASRWVLAAHDLVGLNLDTVTTANNPVAAFPAYLDSCILQDKRTIFEEQYVTDALAFASEERINQALYEKLTNAPKAGLRAFKKVYGNPLRRGFGAFLVALHCDGSIVLPYSFRWPYTVEDDKNGGKIGRKEICNLEDLPPLVALFRNLKSQAVEQDDPVFAAMNLKQRERVAWAGGKIITALGWLEPEHANYADLHLFKRENVKSNFASNAEYSFMMLADVLQKKFGSRVPITPEGWQKQLNGIMIVKRISNLALKESSDTDYLVQQALGLTPSEMAPAMLEKWTALPGLDFELEKASEVWRRLENAYLKKVKRESDKDRVAALGYLNIYLFGYLPYWYAKYPNFQFEYPENPNKLISAVFVSDLGLYEAEVKPLPFVEFLKLMATKREWVAATHYAILKQVEKFFEFVVRVGSQTLSCNTFVQPIGASDYPLLSRPKGTNKKPIPRRIFKVYIQYIEALCAHLEVLLGRIVDGEIHENSILSGLGHNVNVIDTFETANFFGFIPVIFHQNKTIPLRYIPNVLFLNDKNLIGGSRCRVPHPHALYQILVSLFTGLRQQHIQWLDEETFDQEIPTDGEVRDYAELFVNTDKVKTKPWKAYVNFRVIEILRKQRAWRDLVAEKDFSTRIGYNENPDSKWGTILPLFSYYKDGKPHSDSIYATAWRRILSGVQGILPDIGEPNIKLFRFLPPEISIEDADIDSKLFAFGAKQTRTSVLKIKSEITPHSARVSVISHSISILPADLIGKYWTGQTDGTVYHYVVLDEEEIFAEQQLQNLQLRDKGYEHGYKAMLTASPGRVSPYVAADVGASSLSSSIKENLEETLTSYGCISLSLDNDGQTGLDVLRETHAVGAALNKTEVCPFGNHCPTDVVIKLGSFRRCGPCNFAVRSIDHLPAVTAKIRQVFEELSDLNKFLEESPTGRHLTPAELDEAETKRDRLSEDFAAWQMSAEVLEMMRQRVERGESQKIWHIQKPEVIERHLRRVRFPSNSTEYLLARLAESEAFPMLESPQIRSRFELLRRKLLANIGKFQEAFSLEMASDPTAECLGLIRSIVSSHNLSISDLTHMLEGGNSVQAMTLSTTPLLGVEELI